MKGRKGFVSNSSTTSFMIYGMLFEQGDIKVEDGESEHNKLEELFSSEFDLYYPPYDEEVYVGISLDSMDHNETRTQFEDRIDKLMSKKLGRDVAGTTLSGEWQDG